MREPAGEGNRGNRHGVDLALARFPPIVWLACGLLAGQALGAASSRVGFTIVLAVLGGLCPLRRHPLLRLAGCALLAAAFGHFQMTLLLRPELGESHVARRPARSVTMRARIIERPQRTAERVRLLVDVEAIRAGERWEPSTGRVLITVRRAEQSWQRVDRLEGSVRLKRPYNFGNPGEFDYEGYLARRGVYVTGFATTDRAWGRPAPAPDWLAAPFDRWRDCVARLIDAAADGAAGEILAALLIGGTDLSPAVRERYARTGLSHVLSISGLHIALVAGPAYASVRWLIARSEWMLLHLNVPKLAIGVATVPTLLYAGLAGGSVPTVRSVVMGLWLAMATLVDRQRHWTAGLAFAALGIDLVWPGSVLDISFQLSFVAVLAIVLGMRGITMWWGRLEEAWLLHLRGRGWRVVRWLVSYLGVTICATAGTVPLTAWHFNTVSLIGPLANPLVVPLLGTGPVGLGLLAALAAPVFPSGATLLLQGAGAIVAAADALVDFLADAPGAAVRVVTPTPCELVLVYVALAALLLKRRPRLALLGGCALLLCTDAAVSTWQRFHRGGLRITFLSVGHGDCTIVEFPGSATMLIDGGGLSHTFDVGERVVAPYLWRRRVGRIDQMVLTHPDFDHAGGLPFLARAFGPKEFWWDGASARRAHLDRLWRALAVGGAELVQARRGLRRVIDGVEVSVLGGREGKTASTNDDSLALRLRYGSTTLLLVGDLEAAGEGRLLDTVRDALPSHVLKAPHHGSRTSSSPAFLNAVEPRIAVISVGHDDRFGMPHREVLAALRARDVSVWRTDEDGAVMFDIDRQGRIRARGGRGREETMRILPLDTSRDRGLKRGGTSN